MSKGTELWVIIGLLWILEACGAVMAAAGQAKGARSRGLAPG